MNRYCAFVIAALLLSGCTSTSMQPQTTSITPEMQPPVETVPPPTEEMPPIGENTDIVPPETAPVISDNRAVIALLDNAQSYSASGRREAAGASLERALRIEPRNPWLWHELAQLRLAQGQYAQAITLARKSTSFAWQDKRLRALNWRVVGDARVAQGDPAGAEEAFKQAEALEQPEAVPGF